MGGGFRVFRNHDAIPEDERGDVHVKTVEVQIDGESNDGIGNGITNISLKEIGILRALDHPHVIELKGIVMNEVDDDRGEDKNAKVLKSLGFVFPKMECNLETYMKRASEMRELNLLRGSVIKSYSAQLLLALEHCHARGIVHQNVSPQRILLSPDGVLKLAGFKYAKSFMGASSTPSTEDAKMTAKPPLPHYLAPEMLLGCPVRSTAVDVWASGLVLARLLVGGDDFLCGNSEIDQLLRIFELRGTPTPATWPGYDELPAYRDNFVRFPGKSLRKVFEASPAATHSVLALLEGLLCVNPRRRITAAAALGHPYFKQAEQISEMGVEGEKNEDEEGNESIGSHRKRARGLEDEQSKAQQDDTGVQPTVKATKKRKAGEESKASGGPTRRSSTRKRQARPM